MFSRIAGRYDLANRIMTLGMDVGWRRRAAQLAEPRGTLALDVGTGTGDFAIELVRAGAQNVVAVDFVPGMLEVARQKLGASRVPEAIDLANADAICLPFAGATFDCVVSAFALRNVADLQAALGEMTRVLRPGGRLVCLELTHPTGLFRSGVSVYFRRVIPVIGALLTGERWAYRYLPESLGPFPDARELARMMSETGLHDVSFCRLGFGLVAAHRGFR
jgi:demethylmenaquinone methyltransferase/2-methoxy-6-polyprenyl-1,4-benzoquinol methylase